MSSSEIAPFTALGEIFCAWLAAFPGQRAYKSGWLQYPHVRAFPVRSAGPLRQPADALRNNALMCERSGFWAYPHVKHTF